MPSSRNDIRQAAVQLLYARHSSPFGAAEADDVWDLLLDPKKAALDRARVKVLAHFQQGRRRVVKDLRARLQEVSTSIQLAPNAAALARKIENYFVEEEKWQDRISVLPSYAKKDTGDWRNTLHECLEKPAQFRKTRADIRQAIDDSVTIAPQQHQGLVDTMKAIEDYDDRVRKVAKPLDYPGQTDLKHLHATLADLEEFRTRAQALVNSAEARLPEIDEMVTEKLHNYQLDRVSKVDLAIIRLCVYELMFGNDEVPRSVVIKNYLLLAEAFSDKEAARFVNGIVDRFHRQKEEKS